MPDRESIVINGTRYDFEKRASVALPATGPRLCGRPGSTHKRHAYSPDGHCLRCYVGRTQCRAPQAEHVAFAIFPSTHAEWCTRERGHDNDHGCITFSPADHSKPPSGVARRSSMV